MKSHNKWHRSIVIGITVTALIGMAAALQSCTTNRTLLVQAASGPVVPEHRAPIAGYVTSDGAHHDFQGFVQGHGDSLRFVIPSKDRKLEKPIPERVVVAPRDSIRSIDKKVIDYPRTVIAAALLAAVFGMFAYLTFTHPSIDFSY